ncbi:MAG: putative O-glycosylation ligase, exosortase A system-associated [Thiobacillaceae bacterium]
MRDIVLALIVFGVLPFVLSRPSWGVYLSAWLGYMNPHRLCYGFMLSFPVVMVVALTTLVGMIVSREKKRMVWSREIVILLIMLAWMGVTTTQSFFFDLAWEQYVKVIKIQILTLMTLMLLTSREKVHIFVWIIALSLGFYGIKGGIFTIVHGGVYRVQGPLGSFIGGNNEMALALVMTIPLMRYLHLQETRKWVKTGLAGAMLLTALAAVGSQSRGALVALLITGGIFWLKSRGKIMSGLFLVVAVAATAAIMPQEWYERMHSIKDYQEDASAQGRINAWWTAYYVAKDRITGGGFEMFRWPVFKQYAPDPSNVHDVHSIYFEMLGEHGFIGLILFLALLTMTWMKCRSIIRIGKRDKELYWARDLAAMIQVSMVAYMTGGAFLGLAYFDYIYHLIALVAVTAYLIKQQTVQTEPRTAWFERLLLPRKWLPMPATASSTVPAGIGR